MWRKSILSFISASTLLANKILKDPISNVNTQTVGRKPYTAMFFSTELRRLYLRWAAVSIIFWSVFLSFVKFMLRSMNVAILQACVWRVWSYNENFGKCSFGVNGTTTSAPRSLCNWNGLSDWLSLNTKPRWRIKCLKCRQNLFQWVSLCTLFIYQETECKGVLLYIASHYINIIRRLSLEYRNSSTAPNVNKSTITHARLCEGVVFL